MERNCSLSLIPARNLFIVNKYIAFRPRSTGVMQHPPKYGKATLSKWKKR